VNEEEKKPEPELVEDDGEGSMHTFADGDVQDDGDGGFGPEEGE
jgi:hypothetical protein